MQRVTNETRSIRANKREVQFPGICNAADALDVTPYHLRLVLSGKRTSKRLMRRFRLYAAEKKKLAAAAVEAGK